MAAAENGLKDVSAADAAGLFKALSDTFSESGITNFNERLVGFMSDGASVNFGKKSGLIALLQNKSPWLVGLHCLNHRLELAVKDACKGSMFDDVITALQKIYAIFKRSPKRLRLLQEIADQMGEEVLKPSKACGTRYGYIPQASCSYHFAQHIWPMMALL